MPRSLQPIQLDADHVQLAALETQLAEREARLITLKLELHELQTQYLDQIGALYAELGRLEASIAEIEIRAGLRQPPTTDESETSDEDDSEDSSYAYSHTSTPSADLRRVFRDVAKAIHPDLAMNEHARSRRHSLMAEANRAYAERDEDRLRLILRAWERSPDAEFDADPEVEQHRVRRRIAFIDERLVAIDAEVADLGRSAIFRLKGRIDEARAQGWDLFAEMILTVRRDIARATMRLASLHRQGH